MKFAPPLVRTLFCSTSREKLRLSKSSLGAICCRFRLANSKIAALIRYVPGPNCKGSNTVAIVAVRSFSNVIGLDPLFGFSMDFPLYSYKWNISRPDPS